MPLLARAKHRVAAGIGSGAVKADSKQADFFAYLSAIRLAGLLLNALLHWWWADQMVARVMVPIIAGQGWSGLRRVVMIVRIRNRTTRLGVARRDEPEPLRHR
jgi:divalent metal cation (Fe/Co/Zn/Cd) transporter